MQWWHHHWGYPRYKYDHDRRGRLEAPEVAGTEASFPWERTGRWLQVLCHCSPSAGAWSLPAWLLNLPSAGQEAEGLPGFQEASRVTVCSFLGTDYIWALNGAVPNPEQRAEINCPATSWYSSVTPSRTRTGCWSRQWRKRKMRSVLRAEKSACHDPSG